MKWHQHHHDPVTVVSVRKPISYCHPVTKTNQSIVISLHRPHHIGAIHGKPHDPNRSIRCVEPKYRRGGSDTSLRDAPANLTIAAIELLCQIIRCHRRHRNVNIRTDDGWATKSELPNIRCCRFCQKICWNNSIASRICILSLLSC